MQSQYRDWFSLAVKGFDVVFNHFGHGRELIILKQPFELRQCAFQTDITFEPPQQRQWQTRMVGVNLSGVNIYNQRGAGCRLKNWGSLRKFLPRSVSKVEHSKY